MSVLHATGLTKVYPATPPVHALTGMDLDVSAAERLAIIGRSGAGKSTLLNILGLLDEPTDGSYELLGQETRGLSGKRRTTMRAQHLGFVFQDYHVLGVRTAYENLDVKLAVLRTPRRLRPRMILDTLERVGLSSRAHSPARLLSGGEKQRLAIARAIVSPVTVLLADEPTGNLDEENAAAVLDLFDAQVRTGVAIIVITHDPRTAAWADRMLVLRDGQLDREGRES